jgi:hypothetical protein
MVFGLFGGSRRLEQQRTALHACAESLAFVERRVAHLTHLKIKFADVWPESDIQEELATKTGLIRQLAELLTQRVASAKRELADFDGTIDLMMRDLPLLLRDYNAFVGLLIARRGIASGELAIGPVSDPPTVSDCQRALIAIAEGQRDRIRTHIDELTEIKPTFDGPWPDELDLGKVDAGIRDVSGALEIYRERLGLGELAIDSTASLWEMIERTRTSNERIQELRAELAVHTLTEHMLRNKII